MFPVKSVLPGVCVVLAVAAFLNFRGIEQVEYKTDEGMWIYVSQKAWDLFRSGDWDSSEWENFDGSWGYVNPPVAKYLIGGGMALQSVDWERTPRVDPPSEVLAAARRPAAILGVIGCLGLVWIGRRSLTAPGAIFAGLMLAGSPLWITVSRRAMTDVYGTVLAILSVGAFLPVVEELHAAGRRQRVALRVSAAGALSGLAVAAKLNAAATPVALGLALVLLLVREIVAPANDRRRGVAMVVLAGVLFGVTAIGVFVLVNPYLHKDGWTRFWGIVDFWRELSEGAVARASDGRSFLPQEEGVRALVSMALSPVRGIAPLIFAPFVLGFVGRRTWGRATPELARLVAWLVLVPLALAIGMMRSPLMHAWLPWVGFLGAVLTLLSSDRAELAGSVRVRTGLLLLLWSVVVLFFVWRMTYMPIVRYYLPALPVVCLLAGFGLASLRNDLSGTSSTWPVRLLDLAVAAGVLSVLFAFPVYGLARIKWLATEASGPTRVLHWISVASLLTSIAGGALVEARRTVASGVDAET